MLAKTPTIRAHLPLVFVSLLMAAPLAGTARADTLLVPANYPTIQAAIVAAQAGDTVVVAPGRYVETIDFLGKAITVESSGGAEVTTIDGNGGGSVVTFQSGETQTSVLRGLTITGGTGSAYGTLGDIVGGGVRIVGSNPVIRECVISGNAAAGYGGGIFVAQTGLANHVRIENCAISGNATTSSVQGGGGGVAVDSTAAADLDGCSLTGNTSATSGGGFLVNRGSKSKITASLIKGNTAAGLGGGGRYLSGPFGAFGLFEMEDCTITGNSSAGGAGLSVVINLLGFATPSAYIRRCRIEDNHATGSGGGVSGGTDVFAGIWFFDCVFAANTALVSGGGVEELKAIHLVSCTLVGNSAPVGGGLHANSFGGIDNCILWSNSPTQIAGPAAGPRWCDIQGGYEGTGNIDVDPFFVDPDAGDFHLSPTSACLDAGDPTYFSSSEDMDIDGDPRVLFGRIDIGADEATFPKGPWTHLGHALAGADGTPWLAGAGALTPGSETTLSLAGAAPGSASWLVAGAGTLMLPFKGGVMVPTSDALLGPIGVGPAGSSVLSGRWPNDVPPGFVVTLQTWVADATGPDGFTASNGLAAHSQ